MNEILKPQCKVKDVIVQDNDGYPSDNEVECSDPQSEQ